MSSGVLDRTRGAVSELTPGYFAVVMGSGIISIGMMLDGQTVLSEILLWCAILGLAVLVVLNVWRLLAYRGQVVDDFTDPRRAFGFFTFIAGVNVVATRLLMAGHPGIASVLAVVTVLAWFVLGYVVPWSAVLSRTERPVVATANGTWFIWVVASQSVAIVTASLEPVLEARQIGLAVVAVLAWSVGVFMYAAVGLFVSLRMMLYPLGPRDLDPPYWVAMGAASITVLAGARIVEMSDTPMVSAVRALVAGISVVFWMFATWLIPVLAAAGWWRHRSRRVPLRYDATLWSIVFPLGMYGVAGIYLGRADQLPLVGQIGSVELWFALGVWGLVGAAMVVHLVRTVVTAPRRGGRSPLGAGT